MSVYKRPGAETFSYDFQVGGNRFSGDTGETTERKARKEHDRLKKVELARADAAKGKTGARLTVSSGFTRYMEEVGNHHANALTTLSNLEWLQAKLGPKTLLSSIDDNNIAFLVAARRQENRKVGNAKTPPKKVSNATVNRTCTEPLRKVMTRARKKWGGVIQEIDWSGHMLSEPKERIREASTAQEAEIMDGLERGYDDAVSFAFLTGCRRMEIVRRSPHETEERYKGLIWQRVDFFGKTIRVVGKGGKERIIPMTNALFVLLWEQLGHDPEQVFTYVAKRTDKRKGVVRGIRYPMTASGLKGAAGTAIDAGGLGDFHFHDIRHTTATRLLRISGNIRHAQRLLGHADMETTGKYAHSMLDDLRAAMEALSPTNFPTEEMEFRLKVLSGKGNP